MFTAILLQKNINTELIITINQQGVVLNNLLSKKFHVKQNLST
jgi:hypothetical protein